MFISIRWEAILWVVTGSIFRRLNKKLRHLFCKLLALGGPRFCRRNKIKSSQISQFSLDKNAFLQRYVEKGIRSAHPPQKISKPRLSFNFLFFKKFFKFIYYLFIYFSINETYFLINETPLVNILFFEYIPCNCSSFFVIFSSIFFRSIGNGAV